MAEFKNVDKNLASNATIGEEDVAFFDVRNDPFSVYGLYNYRNEECFKRLPDEVGLNVNEGVKTLYLQSAGGRVRFSTDSQYVAIKADMPYISRRPQFSLLGSSGFDLYLDDPETGKSVFWRPFMPSTKMIDGYESKIKFPTRKKRYFTVHFPPYCNVKQLLIGLQQDATVDKGMPYRKDLPIVYYGSSITHGACAGHPGNTYPNIVSQRMNLDHINLGFSAHGLAEDSIVSYMAGLDMLAFVSDYDHNAPNVEHLSKTHLKMYQTIRAAHPHIPYIMLSRPGIDSLEPSQIAQRRDVVYATYQYAREHGDPNVYFIDGGSLFRGPYEGLCTVDSIHPNDLGFALMADAVQSLLERAFSEQTKW